MESNRIEYKRELNDRLERAVVSQLFTTKVPSSKTTQGLTALFGFQMYPNV